MELATLALAACLHLPPDTDSYLYALYERAPKVDNGGTFADKDKKAAAKAGMGMKEYAIGGMSPQFRQKLVPMFYAMEVAGLRPTLNTAFRDDYRQSLITGRNKAQVGYSFHGGSRRGGYGRGLAVDVVSQDATGSYKERVAANKPLWKWIDQHGKHYGMGRPYGDKDPPHVTPVESREYIANRGGSRKKKEALAAR